MNRRSIVKMMVCLTLVGAIAATISTKVFAERTPKQVTYTVQRGDCLDSIAARYINEEYCLDKNVAIYKLRTRIQIANKMQSDVINPGQEIIIPGGPQNGK